MKWYFIDDDNWTKFKNELLSWVGTPYMYGCVAKHRGTDCNQFVAAVLVNTGIIDGFEVEWYAPYWYLHTDQELILEYIERNRKYLRDGLDYVKLPADTNLMRGDYLCFSVYNEKGVINHVGLLLDDNQFISAVAQRGVSILPLEGWWKRHLKCIFRLFSWD